MDSALATSPATSGPGFVYDPRSKTAVLFGGNPGPFDINDTWTWDGVTWTQQFPPVSPSARAFNSEPMAYDAAHGTVVLFGGFSNVEGTSFAGDTWVWDGQAKLWIERFPLTSPSPRATTLTYDGATKEVVIFGGQNTEGYLADTWTWNGTTWTQRFPAVSPPARTNQAMVYDANIGAVVLFGGLSPNGEQLNDTWIWNGTTWTQIQTPFTPIGRSAVSMDYDSNFRGLVMFAGEVTGGGTTNQTWIFR